MPARLKPRHANRRRDEGNAPAHTGQLGNRLPGLKPPARTAAGTEPGNARSKIHAGGYAVAAGLVQVNAQEAVFSGVAAADADEVRVERILHVELQTAGQQNPARI